MPAPKKKLSARQRRIQLIHIGAAQIGKDRRTNEAGYRNMLFAVTSLDSTTKMDDGQHDRVIEHLIASGANIRWDIRQSQSVAAYKKPLIGEIRKTLLHLGNVPDAYADGIAKRMYRLDRFEWCDKGQLLGVLTALKVKLAKVRAGG
jgi:hypothetical protein